MGKSKFQPDWLNKPSYATWLAANRNDAFSAYCQVCRSNFDVTAMGEAAVRSHSTGKRHLANVRRREATCSPVSAFFPRATATCTGTYN